MPTTTFFNLKEAKRDRITKVLLDEFSTNSLNDAKISTIVTKAEIARGAFYKYFADLTDAYQYIFSLAMKSIHQPFNYQDLQADNITKTIQEFVNQQRDSKYHDFIKLYYQKNQYLLPPLYQPDISKLTSEQWSSNILVHQTIKDCLLHPDQEQQYLQFLTLSLKHLFKGA
ncbi:TetR/AcrR family transcriptional regulator [Lactobacillus sanfranciscensis]|uniref:HTH tetR-type domain-containing protein n=1 Tax=Fructilactobacillus sanfranciscensis (strain TMW 1.1304) TaxID=714313 RepID=G2KV64_FRUST|nr:TetR/AcrR family transcriptional regulator [Fructilactobacillus sanfranciscensis]AEN98662.1 hypothetical protein LSA_01940 [Fructilactobacillus sanfranciscensis TMW 1.1304]NDR76412.1 TetR/AcrR family transcriptional regulator [Fructilactobacillus sanfranciscensis]NDR97040.1 TetR/AcrR family transcriptional regulator [Fructilactobacillus sanfranciscensis]NDS04956.1 TetR/AcrR family transcriptional regulator [Fructilactobacillus sanfranciscensis]POH19498.1 hypothetical protein BGL44_05750 [Fr